jgi:hypothetical protein
MFARKEKPLPVAILKPPPTHNTELPEGEGIHLGEGYYSTVVICPSPFPILHLVCLNNLREFSSKSR